MTGRRFPTNDAILAQVEPWAGIVPTGYLPTFFGARTAVLFWAHWLGRDAIANALSGPRQITTRAPTFGDGELFFEQANIARSILCDRPADHDRFIVVELGGGNGPRAVDCALALRQLRPHLKPFLVVVEALPTYFEWCRHHFIANGLDPDEHWIIPGIVAPEPIPALFFLQPRGFGNQMVDANVMRTLTSVITDRLTAVTVLMRLAAGGVFVKEESQENVISGAGATPSFVDGTPRATPRLGDPSTWTTDGLVATATSPTTTAEIGFVSALTLPTILAPLPYVDFMDIDIQFAEIDVIPPHLDLLAKKVRLLSIGTHSKEIHAKLYRCFDQARWKIINDIEPFAHHVQGNESFDNHDGVLTVQNPSVTYDRTYTVALLPEIHNSTIVKKIMPAEHSGHIAVETEDAKWAYAVSYKLYAPPALDGAGEPRVVVDLEVEEGTFGVGCTTADYSSYVDREVLVPSGKRRKVYVPVGKPGAAFHVMLRNGSPVGRSVARIRGSEIRRVTAAEERQELV